MRSAIFLSMYRGLREDHLRYLQKWGSHPAGVAHSS